MAKEDQLERIQKSLGVSLAEAQQILLADKEIDRGGAMPFDLDPEREKVAKKYTKPGIRKPTVYNFDTSKRKKKENPTKEGIIAELAEFLQASEVNKYSEVNVTNKTRQVAFECDGKRYELTLVEKRKGGG